MEERQWLYKKKPTVLHFNNETMFYYLPYFLKLPSLFFYSASDENNRRFYYLKKKVFMSALSRIGIIWSLQGLNTFNLLICLDFLLKLKAY